MAHDDENRGRCRLLSLDDLVHKRGKKRSEIPTTDNNGNMCEWTNNNTPPPELTFTRVDSSLGVCSVPEASVEKRFCQTLN